MALPHAIALGARLKAPQWPSFGALQNRLLLLHRETLCFVTFHAGYVSQHNNQKKDSRGGLHAARSRTGRERMDCGGPSDPVLSLAHTCRNTFLGKGRVRAWASLCGRRRGFWCHTD